MKLRRLSADDQTCPGKISSHILSWRPQQTVDPFQGQLAPLDTIIQRNEPILFEAGFHSPQPHEWHNAPGWIPETPQSDPSSSKFMYGEVADPLMLETGSQSPHQIQIMHQPHDGFSMQNSTLTNALTNAQVQNGKQAFDWASAVPETLPRLQRQNELSSWAPIEPSPFNPSAAYVPKAFPQVNQQHKPHAPQFSTRVKQ